VYSVADYYRGLQLRLVLHSVLFMMHQITYSGSLKTEPRQQYALSCLLP